MMTFLLAVADIVLVVIAGYLLHRHDKLVDEYNKLVDQYTNLHKEHQALLSEEHDPCLNVFD